MEAVRANLECRRAGQRTEVKYAGVQFETREEVFQTVDHGTISHAIEIYRRILSQYVRYIGNSADYPA